MYTGVLVHIATFASLILSQYQVAALVDVIVNNGVASNRGGVIVRGIIGRRSLVGGCWGGRKY